MKAFTAIYHPFQGYEEQLVEKQKKKVALIERTT
jgi:hypothetical protein